MEKGRIEFENESERALLRENAFKKLEQLTPNEAQSVLDFFEHAGREIARLTAELSETQKRLAVAEKALEHYADFETWDEYDDDCWQYTGENALDRPFSIAREALAEINKHSR